MGKTQSPQPRREVLPDVLPHSNEAERVLLGCLILDNSRMDDISGKVSQNDFFLEAHRRIWGAVQELHIAKKQADYVTISEVLGGKGQLESVGGLSYLTDLTAGLPLIVNLGDYCRIVRDHSVRRRLIKQADVLQAVCREAAQDPESIIHQWKELLDGSAELVTKDSFLITLDKFFTDGNSLDSLFGDRKKIISTGFQSLDKLILGLEPGLLYVIAGDSSMGKSSIVTNLAVSIAEQSIPVAYWSMEMGRKQVWKRIMSMKANVSLSKIRHRSITDIERYQIRAVVEQVRQIPLHIDDGAMLDIHTFRYKLRRAIREHGIRVAIVDHLQIMDLLGRKGSTYFDDERQALDYAMRQFKETSREMDVAILVTSQLSRARSKRGSKDSRPKMSDLRGSGGIEQNADVVILLYREEFDRTDRDDLKGKAELIVAKQRDGPTGSVKMRFEDKFVRFVEDT